MPNILEAIKLTERIRRAGAAERRRRNVPHTIKTSCRELLADAAALGLTFDDVIDTVRRSSTTHPSSN